MRTRRRSFPRSRMVSTTLSSTSAVLPPVSRWSVAIRPDVDDVVAAHAVVHDLEALLDRDAELLVLDDAAELLPRRLRRVLDHHAERGDERVAGAQRRRHHLEVVRQLVLEAAPRLGRPVADDRTAPRSGCRRARSRASTGDPPRSSSRATSDRGDEPSRRRSGAATTASFDSSTSSSNSIHGRHLESRPSAASRSSRTFSVASSSAEVVVVAGEQRDAARHRAAQRPQQHPQRRARASRPIAEHRRGRRGAALPPRRRRVGQRRRDREVRRPVRGRDDVARCRSR